MHGRGSPAFILDRRTACHRWPASSRLTLRSSFSEATELSLADLQVMLEDAIRQENYQEAARLRDVLT